MSVTDRPGQLDGQDIYLRNDQSTPYVRSKVPLTPQRSDIEGDTAGVAPDPLLRYWSQEDFSGGAGFPLWSENEIGFDSTDGVVWDDREKRLNPGPHLYVDDSFTDGGPFYVRESRVCTSANAGTDKVSLSYTDSAPTWATDGFAVKAASTPHTIGVISNAGVGTVVSSYTNGDVYLNAALWKAFGVASSATAVVAFRDLCYVLGAANTLDVMDNFTTPTTSTTKVTTPYNELFATTDTKRYLTASDVGPCWLVQAPDGELQLWEYNAADDTSSVLAVLPKGAGADSLLFAYDGYWVPYVEESGTAKRSMWLWFLINGVQGRVGPFRTSGLYGSVNNPQVLGTTDREEIIILWDDIVWAYDVTNASLNLIVDTDKDSVTGASSITDGYAFGDVIALTWDNGKVSIYPRGSTRTAATPVEIYLGAWDGGYPGVRKQLSSVTVSTEPLAANTRVLLQYKWDQESTWHGLVGVHDVDDASTYTFYPSTEFSQFNGDLLQLSLRLENSGTKNNGPYVRKVSAAVMPDESHIEWDLRVDLGDDRSGRLDSKVTADWLWGLSTECTFVDPWSVREHEAGESHNVRILERSLGPVGRDGPQYAQLRLRKVERV